NGGYPPNLQFFEYAWIVSVDGGGLVTLRRPTRYRYADHWPDVTNGPLPDGSSLSTGAARIFKLVGRGVNVPSSWANRKLWTDMLRSVRVEGGHFVGLHANNNLFFNAYESVALNGVAVDANMWPTAGKSFVATESSCTGTIEMDK